MDIQDPAAMVFEEAARLSYQLRQLWPQASALTPKAPAPPKFSHSGAQAHRLRTQIESATLSRDPKNATNLSRVLKPRIMFLSLKERHM
jgi:hypothetical protein